MWRLYADFVFATSYRLLPPAVTSLQKAHVFIEIFLIIVLSANILFSDQYCRVDWVQWAHSADPDSWSEQPSKPERRPSDAEYRYITLIYESFSTGFVQCHFFENGWLFLFLSRRAKLTSSMYTTRHSSRTRCALLNRRHSVLLTGL